MYKVVGKNEKWKSYLENYPINEKLFINGKSPKAVGKVYDSLEDNEKRHADLLMIIMSIVGETNLTIEKVKK